MRSSRAIVAGTALAMGFASLAMLGAVVVLQDSCVLPEGQPLSPPDRRTSPAAPVVAVAMGSFAAQSLRGPTRVSAHEAAPPRGPESGAASDTAVASGAEVVAAALRCLPPSMSRCLRAARFRVVGCRSDPTLHPFNADVRALPRFRDRAAFYRVFGNVLFVDVEESAPQRDRAVLAALGDAVEILAGDLAAEPAFRVLTGDVSAAAAREHFSAWFADWYGTPQTRRQLEELRPDVALHLREVERRVDGVDRWAATMGGARAGRWHLLVNDERPSRR